MKRFLSGVIALFPVAAAAMDASAEPPLEAHPIGTLVFVVLFVGFCLVFAWMVWRNRGKKEDGRPQA